MYQIHLKTVRVQLTYYQNYVWHVNLKKTEFV